MGQEKQEDFAFLFNKTETDSLDILITRRHTEDFLRNQEEGCVVVGECEDGVSALNRLQ